MKFVLPLPPTTNHMYERSRFGVYKTQKVKAWEKNASYIIRKTRIKKTLDKNVYVGVEFFLSRDRDIDNLKPILDALEDNSVIVNDSQVVHLNIKKYKDKDNPRVEVVVERIM